MAGPKRESTGGSGARLGEDRQAEARRVISLFREHRCEGKDNYRAAALVRATPAATAVHPQEGSKGKSGFEQLEDGSSRSSILKGTGACREGLTADPCRGQIGASRYWQLGEATCQ